MDYGFAPGRTAQDRRARRLFQLRENTTLIQRRNLGTLHDFIEHLQNAPDTEVERPIENVLIGAHANSEGFLQLPMYRGQPRGPTQYETLEETLADPTRSVVIPDALLGQAPDDPTTHSVHFKGCNIGKAEPFVVKFKEALGDHVFVTAPKHFHGMATDRLGLFEYMAYEFLIQRPIPLPNRDAILAAFADLFEFLDGTPVSAEDLERWVPRRRLTRTTSVTLRARLGTPIGRRETIPVQRQFRVENLRRGFVWDIDYPTPGDVPTAVADQRADFEESIRDDELFSSSHAFPYYERVGFDDVDGFLAGYTWTFRRRRARLTIRGSRVLYSLVVPIEHAATPDSDLVFNFHPTRASALDPVIQLNETDDDYFLRV